MARQFLVPVRDADDAGNVIAHIPEFAKEGDELVVLIVSEVPEGELIDAPSPPKQVIDPLATTGGVSSEPRAAHDRPVFIGREELMEIRGRELCEELNPQIASLHDMGYGARVEAVFSDEPGETIRDVAGDLKVQGVYASEGFRNELDEETRGLVKAV